MPEQLELVGIPRIAHEDIDEQFSIVWSYSRRGVLEQCPRRYYYQYYGFDLRTAESELHKESLRFLKKLSNRYLQTGKLAHLGIRTYLKALQNGQDWSVTSLLNWILGIYRRDVQYSRQYHLVDSFEGDEYPPSLLSEFYYGLDSAESLCAESEERLVKALTNFAAGPEFERFRSGACCEDALLEKHIRINERDFSAAGQIDLAYPEDGRFVVVDWKIGDTHGSGDSLQLLFYALGVMQELSCAPDGIDLYQAHLADGKISKFAIRKGEIQRAKARIIQDLQKMQALHDYGQNAVAEAFTPCDQERVCALCQFQEVCQRGRVL